MRSTLPLVLVFLILVCVGVVGYSVLHPTAIKTSSVSFSPTSLPASHADGSYIVVVSGPNSTLQITDTSGKVLEEGFFQQSLHDPQTGKAVGVGTTQLYVAKPQDGTYLLKVAGVDLYGLQLLLYDRNANPKVLEYFKGSGKPSAEFKIEFNKENSASSIVTETL